MSKLEDISLQYRKREEARNTYNNNKEFNSAHPNALSDGDEKGKGENNGSIGSSTDIKERKNELTRNRYNRNREYNDATA